MRITSPMATTAVDHNSYSKFLRQGIMLGLSLLAGGLFFAYLSLGTSWRDTPFLGAMVNQTMIVTHQVPNGGENWNGLEAGLLPGDQIIAINGLEAATEQANVTDSQLYRGILNNMSVGDRITVTFSYVPVDDELPRAAGVSCEAGGEGVAICDVAYDLAAVPSADLLALFMASFISGMIVLAIGFVVLRFRYWDLDSFMVVVICMLLSIFMMGMFDAVTTHRYLQLWLVNGIVLGGALITFGMVFPAPLLIIYKNPGLRYVPTALSIIVSIYVMATYQDENAGNVGVSKQIAEVSVIMGIAIMAALMGFYQRVRATTVLARDQANSVSLGVMLALAPTALWFFAGVAQELTGELLFPFSVEASMLFFVTPAISLGYASFQNIRFDTDRIFSQAITYSMMLVALMFGYFLVVSGIGLIATGFVDANNPLLVVMTIFFISLFFVPMRTYLQSRIEQVYFRTRRDYQNKAETFSQQLTSLAGTSVIIKEFRTLLNETLSPINTLIFLINTAGDTYVAYGEPDPETDMVFGSDSGVVKLLEESHTSIYLPTGRPWPPELHVDRAKLGIIRVMVIAGMPGSEQMNGFICIGLPRSGASVYTFEELRFVNNLAGQLTVAIERSHVIGSLERRVRELDVLSQIGQAVNFTIERDDLIELVSAQTLKLVPSSYFYVVLYESETQKLEYVFFLEDDERDNEKENQKWPVGDDLYSEIIQTNLPMRVPDYSREMSRKGYKIQYESQATKAWMSVPLVAGDRTLGALAVGESDPTIRYTDDQLKIFGDIGALAATSLEKARLFSQTDLRARQLAALNDISRQLVATEGDVEGLLDIITTSAVEILNAEAGSLLLTVEDGSEDLVFKVAVGGPGYDLIGTRLPAGHGLVGQVAGSGESVIVNDTSEDERWGGEAVEEEGFHTKSILAVPLVAKDKVIGVLEVINKNDRSVFVEEDVELLTTFAGQAAVAFENARLWQQTDMQLTRRVQELEALERIDRELNRTLDLSQVAEITVRWSIANSGASAGVLGIVTDDQRNLLIVAKRGYEEEDVPEGAKGALWPLDRGIAERVMRTRRSDLQPYVEMDPDYVPLLRKSISQVTVPMLSGGEMVAMLILETSHEPRLNLLDLDWIQRLAEHASIAIANAQLYSELTRANESKSEFMGFAAHELKNPLTSVKGYADLLKSGEINTQQTDFLNVIRSNAERMETIISDLRDIAKMDADQPLAISFSPTSIYQVVTTTLQSYQKNIEDKNQELNNNVKEDLPLIMADQIRLVQVLVNLVSNANKYSPPGSTITVDAVLEDNHLNVDGKPLGQALRVSVTDDGIGMGEADLEKIFKVRYFRSDNTDVHKQPGTGLGMMITQNIIWQHNGTIWVESEPGKGSTFQFTIPLAPQEEVEVKPQSEASD